VRFRLLGSGSSGNATLVEGGGARILLDAGLGPRELVERLQSAGVDAASLDAIVLSHEHGDHAKGAASFARKWGMRIVGTRGTYAALGLGAVEIPGYDVLQPGVLLRFAGLTLEAIPVPHDAAQPVAFVVAADGGTLGHATDLGHIDARLVSAFQACTALLIESNYDPAMLRDGEYPWSLKERILGPFGHLANGDVAAYLARGLGPDCRLALLAHLSQKNNHPELVRMAAERALSRAGRGEVRVEITDAAGTDWLEVGAGARRGPRGQLRLW
jgi:phosphoribosyl 1,2-cyclic phosphodiesterase